GKNSLNRLIRCVCGKKIGPDPRNFNQRVSLGRNDLLIRTFQSIDDRVKHVKDGNTLAAIINHEGCPLSNLQHKSYTIYGMATQANKAQIDALEADVNGVVSCI
ncbi:hypothetical protein ACP8GB_19790, partial [Klebsiella pneumoniae]